MQLYIEDKLEINTIKSLGIIRIGRYFIHEAETDKFWKNLSKHKSCSKTDKKLINIQSVIDFC